MARDRSEICTSQGRKAYCAQNRAVKETKLESAFSRYEVYEDKMREAYHPKGLLTYTTAAREHMGDTPAPKTVSMRQIQTTATTDTLGDSSLLLVVGYLLFALSRSILRFVLF